MKHSISTDYISPPTLHFPHLHPPLPYSVAPSKSYGPAPISTRSQSDLSLYAYRSMSTSIQPIRCREGSSYVSSLSSPVLYWLWSLASGYVCDLVTVCWLRCYGFARTLTGLRSLVWPSSSVLRLRFRRLGCRSPVPFQPSFVDLVFVSGAVSSVVLRFRAILPFWSMS